MGLPWVQAMCMHAMPEGGAHMHGAVLRGGHGLKRAWAPARQLAALRGLVPQLRILLDGLQESSDFFNAQQANFTGQHSAAEHGQ